MRTLLILVLVFVNIYSFAQLSLVEEKIGILSSAGLGISPSGEHVYATSTSIQQSAGGVFVYSRNKITGQLTFLQHIDHMSALATNLDGARNVVVSQDGKHAYVVALFANAISVFERDPNTGLLTFVEDFVHGVPGLNLIAPFDLTISPDGLFVYVAAYVGDAISIFQRNPETGKLTSLGIVEDNVGTVQHLDGVISLAISQDGKNLYAASIYDNSLTVFNRNLSIGELTFVEDFVTGINGGMTLVRAIYTLLSPDDKFVHVTGNNSINVFSRSPVTGGLTFVEAEENNLNGITSMVTANAIAISPERLYVGSDGSNSHYCF